MESQKAASPEPSAGGTSERSTIEFPYVDIDNAQEIVRGIHAVGGTACTYEQLAAHLGQEPKGGGFRLRVNGTKTYGFIDYERGGTIKILDLGFQVMEASEERAAKVQAFLNVPLYAKVHEEFKGRQLPPQAGLERALRNFGVGPKVADRARQVMLRAAKQAGFMDLQADRLTLPPVKMPEKAPEKKSETTPKPGGSGGGGEGLHPLIQGLFVTLPKPGESSWSVQERMDWLVMANSILKNVYKSQDQGDVTITLKGTTTT
jgi:hypothetical protein